MRLSNDVQIADGYLRKGKFLQENTLKKLRRLRILTRLKSVKSLERFNLNVPYSKI